MTAWRSLFCATACSAFVCVALISPSVPQIQGPEVQGSLLCFLHSSSPKINEQRWEKTNKTKKQSLPTDVCPGISSLQTNERQKRAFSLAFSLS